MRFPAECYQMLTTLDAHFASCLRPAQRRCLACWVVGTIRAQSACQHAVIAALLPLTGSRFAALRQYLREWLYDGQDKAAPTHTQVEVTACFAPLLGWVLSLWQGDQLALAVDVTNLGDRLHVLCVSVVYRGCAIPVAWHVLPGGQKGAWLPHLCRLLDRLAPAVPHRMTVLVLMDAGLRSPALWQRARAHGWHPMQRLEQGLQFRPAGYRHFHRADSLVPTPGQAWVGHGTAFKGTASQRPVTLAVVWDEEQATPWVVATDLPAADVGLVWYGLRFWIECGFRILKGMGWQWQKTLRTEPTRVARHWLVLALATGWVLATGTRVEDAQAAGREPVRFPSPPPQAPPGPRPERELSVFQAGLRALQTQLGHRRLWRAIWLLPDPWPDHPPGLIITRLRAQDDAP